MLQRAVATRTLARQHTSTRSPTQLERATHLCEACEDASTLGVQPALAIGRVLARFPGDGMDPPGDCGVLKYAGLLLSVESAKSIVSMMGACAPGDSCTFLATKIAAVSAEIAARVTMATTCFKGGDAGHRQQIQDKINMLNRCYRFFETSNCSPKLIAAMEVVVAAARAVVEAAVVGAAAAVIVAAVVALVAAIIALIDVIAAAAAAVAAAAAEAAAVAAALAATAALLIAIKGALAPASTEASVEADTPWVMAENAPSESDTPWDLTEITSTAGEWDPAWV